MTSLESSGGSSSTRSMMLGGAMAVLTELDKEVRREIAGRVLDGPETGEILVTSGNNFDEDRG